MEVGQHTWKYLIIINSPRGMIRNLMWFWKSGGLDENWSTYGLKTQLMYRSEPTTTTFIGPGAFRLLLQLRDMEAHVKYLIYNNGDYNTCLYSTWKRTVVERCVYWCLIFSHHIPSFSSSSLGLSCTVCIVHNSQKQQNYSNIQSNNIMTNKDWCIYLQFLKLIYKVRYSGLNIC